MIHVSAPGKLMIAGEWAVLEPGNPAIVAAVNKRVHCKILESKRIEIELKDFSIRSSSVFKNNNLEFTTKLTEEEKKKSIFTKTAIETTLRYLGKHKSFKIITWGENTTIKGKKIGFGSSAAATVAIIASLFAFNNHDIKSRKGKDLIYKLAAISHYNAQGKTGSSFDIAASTYGGIFSYIRFDPVWLEEKIKENKIQDIMKKDWPGFHIEELGTPEDLSLIVVWTGKESNTREMIRKMNDFLKRNPVEYCTIYDKIANNVYEIIDAWNEEDKDRIIGLLRKNALILRELTNKSKINIETIELRKIGEISEKYGGAGKLSGAGGGDCGIVVCFNTRIMKKITEALKKEGLEIIDVKIEKEGVKIER